MNISHSARLFGFICISATLLITGCANAPSDQAASAQTGHAPPPLQNAVAAPPLAPPELRPDHPQTYTVVPGDTLWSIAGRFLKNPWQWQQIWRENPQIRNPNRIYPGDVLRFSYDADGNPQLEVAEREEVPLIRLAPQVRTEEITDPIPPVPRSAISSFLTKAVILSDADWKSSAYIVADDDNQLVYTDRDRIYALGGELDEARYQIFRPNDTLTEPGSGRSLGVLGIYMGQAELEKEGPPASLVITGAVAPIRAGDRLLSIEPETEVYSFAPHPVPPDTSGNIIANLDPINAQITQYSSVAINLGAQEGLEPGHVLAVYGRDRQVPDPVTGGSATIPGERSGLIMVYKVNDLVSYAIVMQAERAMRMGDLVTTP